MSSSGYDGYVASCLPLSPYYIEGMAVAARAISPVVYRAKFSVDGWYPIKTSVISGPD
jgi:hypothetical protein